MEMEKTETNERVKEAISTLFELREDLTDEDIFDLNELVKLLMR